MSGMTLDVDAFSREFPTLKPLILQEWPGVSEQELSTTEGAPEEVVRLIADRTDHSRTLIRAQLGELQFVARGQAEGASRVLSRMEARLGELAEGLRDDVVPKAKEHARALREQAEAGAAQARARAAEAGEAVEAKARENLLASLLIALGFGLLLGLLLGSRAR